MLSDRDYMREDGGAALSMTARLLIVLTAAFAFQAVNAAYLGWPVDRYGVLAPETASRGQVWRLFTYQFLHGGFLHLLFNGIGLWSVGRVVEAAFGGGRMLGLWIAGGVAGGLLQLLAYLVTPGVAVGASAGLMTLLAVFCTLEPEAPVMFNFVIPVRAKYLLWFGGAVSLFFVLVPVWPGVAHGAHLGGLLFGWAYIHFGFHREFGAPFRLGAIPERLRELFRGKPAPTAFPQPPRARSDPAAGPRPAASDTDFIAREVDPILEKIARHGIHSLTDKERRTLESARAKVAKR